MPLGDALFYHPTRTVYDQPESYGLRHEPMTIRTDDGLRLDAWFFPADVAPARGTVVHVHGNAGNITGHFAHVAWLPAAGWNLLCFDYRGYGRSQGKPSRAGLVADTHAAIDAVRERADVAPQRIVLLGQSLGGAISIVVGAQRRDLAGIAVEGAFSHYRRIAQWHVRRSPLLLALAWWVPRVLIADELNPIDHVARVAPTPLFILHGRNDEVVDPAMAEELHGAAGEPKELWLIDGARHYGAFDDLADVARTRVLRFFDACVSRATTP